MNKTLDFNKLTVKQQGVIEVIAASKDEWLWGRHIDQRTAQSLKHRGWVAQRGLVGDPWHGAEYRLTPEGRDAYEAARATSKTFRVGQRVRANSDIDFEDDTAAFPRKGAEGRIHTVEENGQYETYEVRFDCFPGLWLVDVTELEPTPRDEREEEAARATSELSAAPTAESIPNPITDSMTGDDIEQWELDSLIDFYVNEANGTPLPEDPLPAVYITIKEAQDLRLLEQGVQLESHWTSDFDTPEYGRVTGISVFNDQPYLWMKDGNWGGMTVDWDYLLEIRPRTVTERMIYAAYLKRLRRDHEQREKIGALKALLAEAATFIDAYVSKVQVLGGGWEHWPETQAFIAHLRESAR